jgi:hypothetical protein
LRRVFLDVINSLVTSPHFMSYINQVANLSIDNTIETSILGGEVMSGTMRGRATTASTWLPLLLIFRIFIFLLLTKVQDHVAIAKFNVILV